MIPFSVARIPRVIYGNGCVNQVCDIVQNYGKNILLVTGTQSFFGTIKWDRLCQSLHSANISYSHFTVDGEPSPRFIDDCVKAYFGSDFNAVVGIGGGSTLDAAKAIAGLLTVGDSVMDYLEGVGPEKKYRGPSIPFVAVPTTAGTGSEATKNAVLSHQGKDGFKKSFRDDKLVAEYALIDPELLLSCAKSVVAANGMDALTQLIESYVSLKANAFTDALALSGIQAVSNSLLAWYQSPADNSHSDIEHAAQMAYAALMSGITLAQVGLGSVHGLASPLGAFYPIPHGVVCGTLLAQASELNISVMRARDPENVALHKYAKVAEILCQQSFSQQDEACVALLNRLQQWTELLELPRLSAYCVTHDDVDRIVAHARGSSMQTNPIFLSDSELVSLLNARI
ncbi:MAG: iron-containing alcohol dehydrogenase [Thiohalomonadales bacterium]